MIVLGRLILSAMVEIILNAFNKVLSEVACRLCSEEYLMRRLLFLEICKVLTKISYAYNPFAIFLTDTKEV